MSSEQKQNPMRTYSKDLLRLEKSYITGEDTLNHKSLMIKSLFKDKKIHKKPDFSLLPRSSCNLKQLTIVLGNAKDFLEAFKKDTDDLLNDENRLKKAQIEVEIRPSYDPVKSTSLKSLRLPGTRDKFIPKFINGRPTKHIIRRTFCKSELNKKILEMVREIQNL